MKTRKIKMAIMAVLATFTMMGCGGDVQPTIVDPDLGTNQTNLDEGQGTGVEVLASGLRDPYGVVRDHTHVYFLNVLEETGGADLMKVSRFGGEPVVLLNRIETTNIAVDNTNIYWLDYASGAVMTISKWGGYPWALTVGGEDVFSMDIEVDGFYIYWTTSKAIMRVSKWGGLPKIIALIEYPANMVMDDTFIYTFSGTALGGGNMSILKVAKTGGIPQVLAGPLNDAAWMVGVKGDELYFKTFWGGDLMKIKKYLYGQPEVLATYVSTGGHTVIMDRDYFYLSGINGVSKLALDGSEPVLIAYDESWGLTFPLSLDDKHIYASAFGPCDQNQGLILKIDKDLAERE